MLFWYLWIPFLIELSVIKIGLKCHLKFNTKNYIVYFAYYNMFLNLFVINI